MKQERAQGTRRRLALFEDIVVGLLRKPNKLAELDIKNLYLQVRTFRFQIYNSVTGHVTLAVHYCTREHCPL